MMSRKPRKRPVDRSCRVGQSRSVRACVFAFGAMFVMLACTSTPSIDGGIDPMDAMMPVDAAMPPEVDAHVDATDAMFDGPDATGEPYAPCPTTGPCYVMPLGDSITAGYLSSDGSGYLSDLQTLAAGLSLEYVGTGMSTGGRHEGHPGWVIQQIRDNIDTFVSTCTDAAGDVRPPNVVLLMIGTNDTNGRVYLDTAPARLGDLLDRIAFDLPETLTVVAQIVPNGDGSTDSSVVAPFNAAIPSLVATRVAAGQHVVMVDMHSALTYPADFGDGLHPNDAGYTKIAAVWYAVLGPLLHPS